MSAPTHGHAIPDTPLVASAAFGPALPASRVAGAIARGLRAGGVATAELFPLEAAHSASAATGRPPEATELPQLLQALAFEQRMRGARALIVAERCLREPALERSITFELATRARQAGVPAYAVTAENRLDSFDARMLDLQLIFVASSTRALLAAGKRLAQMM